MLVHVFKLYTTVRLAAVYTALQGQAINFDYAAFL